MKVFPNATAHALLALKTAVLASLICSLVACAPRTRETGTLPDKPANLFALSAQSGAFDAGRLTLNEVPYVIYFSNRPKRLAGHLTVAQFLAQWDVGPNSFEADPPNAVLSIFSESGAENAVVELTRPQAADDSVTFDVRILDGKVPASFGQVSLFIDEIRDTGPWTGT